MTNTTMRLSHLMQNARVLLTKFPFYPFPNPYRGMKTATTTLWKAMEDGSETPINEVDLYKYQRYRWLSGEPQKLAVRYRNFNLRALLDASVGATGNRGGECVKLLKCVEGQFNKAFVLTMQTGEEVVARLPNPNAGPAFYTVASEVATRHFLRDILGIPIPQIYAWSTEASNPVGAEYIVEEKATGQPLGTLWNKMSMASRLEIVNQIVQIEKKLASVSFPRHGCIYYETGLKSRPVSYEPLDLPASFTSLSTKVHQSRFPNFVIGPLVTPKLWEGKRASMNLDRGPWNHVTEYSIAVGKNELEWAESNAEPRINPYRSLEYPETPEDYVSLLKRYMALTPYLVPTSMSHEQANRISHPDLHLDNIFIDPVTNNITCIIDWQLASVSPICLHRRYPQMLEFSVTAQSDQFSREKTLLDYYYNAVKEADPLRWTYLNDPLLSVRTDPISLVPGCWDRDDIFSLRNALITIIARWSDIGHTGIQCPVDFTEDELLQHEKEMELIEGISKIMQQLEDEGLIPFGGMVRQEFFEHAKELNDIFKQEFMDLAENEAQRKLHEKAWPYS